VESLGLVIAAWMVVFMLIKRDKLTLLSKKSILMYLIAVGELGMMLISYTTALHILPYLNREADTIRH
jgi:hypothetical protein